MSAGKEVPILTAKQWEEARHAAAAWGVRDEIETALEALANGTATVIATAELEALKRDSERLVWAMDHMGMKNHSNDFIAHVLRRCGTGDLSDCRTFVDERIAQEKTNG